MSFDWTQRTAQPVLDLPFVEGVPSPEKAQLMNRWVLDNKDRYAGKLVKLYHGTDPSLLIEEEGLKPTSATRRRSYQSQSGYVYLANTPERAEVFGKLGNQGRCAVYEVIVLVKNLRADLDQLNNQRAAGRFGDIGNTVGESIIYGGGVRIKGALEAWQVRRMAQPEIVPPKWPSKEELLRLWFDNAPTVRSPYQLYGCPPMWETLRYGDLVLFTGPGKTQIRPAPFMPYQTVDGVSYQWQRNGGWVGQGCSDTFEHFEANGASQIELNHGSRTPVQLMPPMTADEFWAGQGGAVKRKPAASGMSM